MDAELQRGFDRLRATLTLPDPLPDPRPSEPVEGPDVAGECAIRVALEALFIEGHLPSIDDALELADLSLDHWGIKIDGIRRERGGAVTATLTLSSEFMEAVKQRAIEALRKEVGS